MAGNNRWLICRRAVDRGEGAAPTEGQLWEARPRADGVGMADVRFSDG